MRRSLAAESRGANGRAAVNVKRLRFWLEEGPPHPHPLPSLKPRSPRPGLFIRVASQFSNVLTFPCQELILVTDLLIDRFRKPIQTWKQCRKANIHIFKVAGERNAPSQ